MSRKPVHQIILKGKADIKKKMWAAGSWKAKFNTMNDTPNPVGRDGRGGTMHCCLPLPVHGAVKFLPEMISSAVSLMDLAWVFGQKC